MSHPPPYEKNKVLLNEYLGDFMHFDTLFFLNLPLGKVSKKKKKKREFSHFCGGGGV